MSFGGGEMLPRFRSESAQSRRNRRNCFDHRQMEASDSRKERLKALREAKKLLDGEHGQPVLKFRNYELRDDKIGHVKVDAQPPEYATSCSASAGAAVSSRGVFDRSCHSPGPADCEASRCL